MVYLGKIMRKVLLILLVLTIGVFAGCDIKGFKNDNSDLNDNKEVVKDVDSITLFTGYNIFENDNSSKYEIVDSFMLPDGKYYYLFLLGVIDAAPI